MGEQSFQFGHERLEVWRLAMQLVVECYRFAQRLPLHERYGLGSQIRRAVVSIPTNIAEGCARVSVKDRLHFLVIARASLCELETLLEVAVLLDYAPAEELALVNQKLGHVGRLISGLRRSVQRRANQAL